MIEDILTQKYGNYLTGLDIYENKNSLILSRIIIKEKVRRTGIGTEIMKDLIEYADSNKQIIALTPSNDFGGDKNRLIQFYKKFGFKTNNGVHKNFQFNQSMIRYPKLNEMKSLIKKLLNESLFDKSDEQIKSIDNFIIFASKELDIEKPTISFQFNHDNLVTTAAYGNGKIFVYVKDRAIIDVMRSIAHEMVHLGQDNNDKLDPENHEANNKAGSPIENEANAKAGEIIRKYGEIHPNIYI
jgi:predicted GNAT family acetyltransferase